MQVGTYMRKSIYIGNFKTYIISYKIKKKKKKKYREKMNIKKFIAVLFVLVFFFRWQQFLLLTYMKVLSLNHQH